MHKEINEFALKIAIEAGAIQLKGFRSAETVITYKSRTNLLTNIDKASEDFLVNEIYTRFPDHAVVAEEGNRKDSDGEYIWYVDPLDGTNNFAHGLPFFCVSLGVFSRKEKKVIAGVVYNPFLDELFTARTGNGAYCNGRGICVSKTADIGISLVATGFPYDRENMEKNNLREFNRILPLIQGIRRMGSAALDLCYVACGRMDAYWEQQLSPWDTAGGCVIVQEAGGRITGFNGSAFDPECPEILASNGMIHDQMMGFLKDT